MTPPSLRLAFSALCRAEADAACSPTERAAFLRLGALATKDAFEGAPDFDATVEAARVWLTDGCGVAAEGAE